ncbi:MAG: MSMEG_0567/Sll0786 family nitrogen starvation N-acetyltransferase [Panacagrimonas sp.]
MPADIQVLDWVPAANVACAARYQPDEFRVKCAGEAWELREAAALRRAVFCAEQQLFQADDADALDERATHLVALSCWQGMPDHVVGTVRIHLVAPGHWHGSRLAVEASSRRIAWLGSELIRMAVGTARARGATRFTAHVQPQNEALFRRLHWRTLGTVELCGRVHLEMQAELDHYPPCADGEQAYIAGLRRAA